MNWIKLFYKKPDGHIEVKEITIGRVPNKDEIIQISGNMHLLVINVIHTPDWFHVAKVYAKDIVFNNEKMFDENEYRTSINNINIDTNSMDSEKIQEIVEYFKKNIPMGYGKMHY